MSKWKYVNSNTGAIQSGTGFPAPFTVSVTDPASNVTVYTFSGEYQTDVQYYEGPATGNPLKEVVTCYGTVNSSKSACVNNGNAQLYPTAVYTYLNGSSSPSLVATTYDTYGNVTQVANYDYGAAYPPSSSPAPLSTTTTVYDNPSGSSYPCGTLANAYINNRPCSITTTNSSGTVSETTYTYNSTGHPITTSKWVSNSTGSLNSSASYTNGVLTSMTDVNGAVYTYGYTGTGACPNPLLPTSVTVTGTGLPSNGLTTWTQWDTNCDGAVVASTLDANLQKTSTSYVGDPYYRPLSTTDALGNITNYKYTTTSFESWMNFNGSVSTTDAVATTDGLGRTIFGQTRQGQGPGTTAFDSTQTAYGWESTSGACTTQPPFTTGACTTQSVPYSGTEGAAAPSGTAVTTTQYDAIGRPLTVTDGGGGTTSYQYIQNDVLQKVGPTQTFQKQLQYDGLGRLTSVCEITSAAGSGPCNQTNSVTGFLTKYYYDALGNLLTVIQNAQGTSQTRNYVYDGLSRLVSETNPESGKTTYTYDAVPTSCYNYNDNQSGNLTAKVDANNNTTCYHYDGLHRLADVGNSNQGTTNPCKRFRYDNTQGYFGSIPSGVTVTNTLGRLAEAATDSCTSTDSMITDEWFSYDADGRQINLYESTPNSGAYYNTSASYWANGALSALNGVPHHSDGWTFGVDGEGRPNTATDVTTSTNLVTSATYHPTYSQTTVTLGSGDIDTYTYDPKTGRMATYQFTIGTTPKNIVGTLGWNANWTLGTLGITDPFNSKDTQNCSYGYDALARLNSVNCVNGSTTVWTQSFTFDAFGNISKSGNSSFVASYLLANGTTNNREQMVSSCVPTYDADGDLTTDCTNNDVYAWNVYGDPTTLNGVGITYDALDRAVEQDNGGTYKQILYSPTGKKLALMAKTIADNVFLPLPGGEQANYTNSTIRYSHYDWLGSARAESGVTPPLVGDVAYAPFGETYSPETSIYVSFTGQNQDTISGLYDFLYREYSPVQGRWISPDRAGLSAVDPSNPQSWNRYAYVLNNPLSNTDPTGLECVWDDGSYDSEDDQLTGSYDKCIDAGGNWVDHSYFVQNGLPDWSGAADPCFGNQNCVTVNGTPDPASTMQCAAAFGQKYSLASGLQYLTGGRISQNNLFVSAFLGNDVSTLSNLLTGPNRLGNLASTGIANPTTANLAGQATKLVANAPNPFSSALGTATFDAAGNVAGFAAPTVAESLAASAFGRGAGKLLSTAFAEFTAAKLIYDAGTYAIGAVVCNLQQQ